jgi:hypothetical protein
MKIIWSEWINYELYEAREFGTFEEGVRVYSEQRRTTTGLEASEH